MIKSRGTNGKAVVTFTLDPRVGADRAAVCGEFNGWAEDTHEMQRSGDGGFSLSVELDPGRAYRFRYLLDGDRWENDWAADAYVPNDFGADDSLVDLTALAEEVPPAARKAPAKQATATKAGGTKAAAPAKTAARKAPAAKKAAPARKAAKKPAD
jgi:predicted carbohydrate-binding protein with CBM48